MKNQTPLRLSDKSRVPLNIRHHHLVHMPVATSNTSASDGQIWFPSTSPPSSSSLYLLEVRAQGANTAARVSARKKRRRAIGGEREVGHDVTGGHDEGITWMGIFD